MGKESDASNNRKLDLEKDLTMADSYNHDISGARLILAQTVTQAGKEPSYIVAWISPWQKKIGDYRGFATMEAAKAAFAEQKHRDPPETPSLCRDWQQTKTYRWEDRVIGKGTQIMDEEQMKKAIVRISQDFNLAAPDLSRKKPKAGAKNYASYYFQDTHNITMRHKQFHALLHEIAHAIDFKINRNRWSPHGPSFIATLILLADRYHWCDSKKLMESAKEAGLSVLPVEALPCAKPAP